MHRDAILHKLNENPLGSQTIPGVMVLAGSCVHNRIYYYRLDNEFFLTSKAGIIFWIPVCYRKATRRSLQSGGDVK